MANGGRCSPCSRASHNASDVEAGVRGSRGLAWLAFFDEDAALFSGRGAGPRCGVVYAIGVPRRR